MFFADFFLLAIFFRRRLVLFFYALSLIPNRVEIALLRHSLRDVTYCSFKGFCPSFGFVRRSGFHPCFGGFKRILSFCRARSTTVFVTCRKKSASSLGRFDEGWMILKMRSSAHRCRLRFDLAPNCQRALRFISPIGKYRPRIGFCQIAMMRYLPCGRGA
jgi:hypothetical protein